MRQCPICNIALVQLDYEGFRIFQCTQCGGHFAPQDRVDSIKRVGRTPEQALKAEATARFKASSTEILKCPRCHGPMKKKYVDLPIIELEIDECRHCEYVWLDGGELALLQLGYQATSKFIDAQEFKRRMEELEASPERKAAFEKRLSELPLRLPEDELLDDIAESFLWDLICWGPR